MAPVAALVAPRTLDAHNAFLRDESKHSVNGICANKQVVISHNGVDANKQLISQGSQQQQQQQHHPGQEYLSRTTTVAQQVVDDRREKDLNDSLLSGRGGNRAPSAITEQEQELTGRRKVRWNDSHGNELVEVWEFQPSSSMQHAGGILFSSNRSKFKSYLIFCLVEFSSVLEVSLPGHRHLFLFWSKILQSLHNEHASIMTRDPLINVAVQGIQCYVRRGCIWEWGCEGVEILKTDFPTLCLLD